MINEAPGKVTVEFDVHLARERKGRKRTVVGPRPRDPVVPVGRLPRVTRLMALAIRFDDLIQRGEVRDYAEIARLGHVSRARLSQITHFALLTPDIQEALLNLPRVESRRDPITERNIRPIAAVIDWVKQRRQWQSLTKAIAHD